MRLLVPTALAVALLAAGCGGSKSPGVANVAATTTTTSATGAVAFAACMRSHGVPNWPSPGPDGAFDKAKLVALGLPKAQMIRLQQPCLHLLPAPGGPNGSDAHQQRIT